MSIRHLLPVGVLSAGLVVGACSPHPSFPGALDGMSGTTATEVVNEQFFARLADTPTGRKGLPDTDFAAETYDAVVIVALAAEAAHSDGTDLARQISGITKEGTTCSTFATCLDVLRGGGNPSYSGAAGARPLNDAGEPDSGNYQIETFGPDNRLDPARRTFRKGSRPSSVPGEAQPIEATRTGDGTLHIGALQPLTGRASIYLPPVAAAWELAIADINAAGGVLGHPVAATVADATPRGATTLLGDGVDVVIAASSSASTLEVIDQIVSAGVPMFSPLNTAPALSTYPDKGLYFRNLPSDLIQADTLAHLIAERGNTSVSILAVDDAYGNGLSEQLRLSLAALGVEVRTDERYNPNTVEFFPYAKRILAADPDAVVLVSFGEASRALRALVVSGVGPNHKQYFGTDGTTSNTIGELFDSGN